MKITSLSEKKMKYKFLKQFIKSQMKINFINCYLLNFALTKKKRLVNKSIVNISLNFYSLVFFTGFDIK
jgi:hypothetical protein